jgi:hypothetical protein
MAGLIGIDCIASFVLRSVSFNCELDYLHEGDHQRTLHGQEYRIVRYGIYEASDASTVLRWPRTDGEPYTFHDKHGDVVPRESDEEIAKWRAKELTEEGK